MRKLLALWQKKLGLQDWSISVEERDDLGGSWASVNYQREEKIARIAIERQCPEPERRLVHELLHLMLLPVIPPGDGLHREEEALVCALTISLVPRGRKMKWNT